VGGEREREREDTISHPLCWERAQKRIGEQRSNLKRLNKYKTGEKEREKERKTWCCESKISWSTCLTRRGMGRRMREGRDVARVIIFGKSSVKKVFVSSSSHYKN
jgi:hypothetical protein